MRRAVHHIIPALAMLAGVSTWLTLHPLAKSPKTWGEPAPVERSLASVTDQRSEHFPQVPNLSQVPSAQWNQADDRRAGRGWGNPSGRRGEASPRDSFPTWDTNPDFKSDVFTFARINFTSYGPFGWHDRWDNDWPDADLNISLRLQQLTSLAVDPNAQVVELTDIHLFDFPFVYLAGVQYMTLSLAEQTAFRRYLENGGFFMMDDLWGLESRENVSRQMLAVLPNVTPIELSLDHEIFHMVYDLQELPQVTDYQTWSRGHRFEYAHEGDNGDVAPHFLAYHDYKNRMLGLVCHNNDLGDGWEREGHHPDYFQEYSVKHSYPFGINLITYVMSH